MKKIYIAAVALTCSASWQSYCSSDDAFSSGEDIPDTLKAAYMSTLECKEHLYSLCSPRDQEPEDGEPGARVPLDLSPAQTVELRQFVYTLSQILVYISHQNEVSSVISDHENLRAYVAQCTEQNPPNATLTNSYVRDWVPSLEESINAIQIIAAYIANPDNKCTEETARDAAGIAWAGGKFASAAINRRIVSPSSDETE
jgi:hypothetical protein